MKQGKALKKFGLETRLGDELQMNIDEQSGDYLLISSGFATGTACQRVDVDGIECKCQRNWVTFSYFRSYTFEQQWRVRE